MPAKSNRNRLRSGISGLGRGTACFFGVFALLNVVADWRHPGFDATLWWIDIRWISPAIRQFLLLVAAMQFLHYAMIPCMDRHRRVFFLGMLLVLVAACLSNAITFWSLIYSGRIHSRCPVPLSMLMIAFLGLIAWSTQLLHDVADPKWIESSWVVIGICGCSVLFPLGQMLCFGLTDYRRSADIIVVFGCRVYSDGTPSHALHDRVRTAAELYRSGFARRIFLSGGPGDGPVHETEAMRRLAIRYGVDPDDLLIDDSGSSTESTVRNILNRSSSERFNRILAVSHFYHLPRIKLCFHRNGSEVFTVPACEDYILRGLTKFMAREVLAIQWYYFEPLFNFGEE